MYRPARRNLETLKSLQTNVVTLSEPLEYALWDLGLDPDLLSGFHRLRYELQMCVLRLFCRVDRINNEAFELYADFCWMMHIESGDLCNQDHQAEVRRTEFEKLLSLRKEEMLSNKDLNHIRSIEALEKVDALNGSKWSSLARDTFSTFVEATFDLNYRGRVKPASLMEEFRTYISGVEISTSSEASPYARRLESNRTVADNEETINDVLAELMLMIGLDRVKADVTQMVNFIRVQQLRTAQGLPASDISRHLVFSGNPGTGKTSIARILSRIYKQLGLLSRGHLVETDRAGLVAGYVGQTALKTKEVAESALGGVLFIDEAYSLNVAGDNDFGREAIDTLLKFMEDNRDDLIVIVAGYTSLMDKFLSSNPGIRSRFNKFLAFDDYSPPQLSQIFESFCLESGFQLSESGQHSLDQLFLHLFSNRDDTFGNGRLARNIFEQSITNQATRIIGLPNIDKRTLSLITEQDIPSVASI